MRLYFVRHGQTDYNLKNAYYGWADIGLNDCGRAQAAQVADLLSDVRFDELWASDLRRVTETVDIILKHSNVSQSAEESHEADEIPGRFYKAGKNENMPRCRSFLEFREMNFGKWEGLDYAGVQERFPEDLARWCDDWKEAPPTGGECFAQFYARVKQCFEMLTDSNHNDCQSSSNCQGDSNCQGGSNCQSSSSVSDGRRILVAAHNGTLRVLFAVMMGLSMDGTWHFNFEQDAYSVVDYEYNNFTIRKINSREKVCPALGRN